MDTKRIRYFISQSSAIIPGALLGIMAVLIFAQVINRYFIQYPIDWIEELARYIYILGTYIGLYAVTREGRHLSVEYIQRIVSVKNKRLILYLVYTVTILFCGYITFFSGKMVHKMALGGATSDALQIPMALIFAAIPIGIGLMGISTLLTLKDLYQTEEGSFTNKDDKSSEN